MKLITLKISRKNDQDNYKIIEVQENTTLYRFAEIIVKSFGFYFDHAFGFYSNITNPYKSELIHELFTDMEDVETTPNAKGVQKYYFISDLFEKHERILFIFDYGDNWEFIIAPAGKKSDAYQVPKNYYKIIKSHGENPEQYPGFD